MKEQIICLVMEKVSINWTGCKNRQTGRMLVDKSCHRLSTKTSSCETPSGRIQEQIGQC